ncbi:MAG: hypothetical protein F6J87_27675 [Spirulina sp. SIO3F2]|nr:hypothetical protein [Spirulina sp. SIO3F2]
MPVQQLNRTDQLYAIYAKSVDAEVLTTQEWQFITDLQSLPNLSEEWSDITRRVSYLVRKGRIRVV